MLAGLEIIGVSGLLMMASAEIQYCSQTPPPPQIEVYIAKQPVAFNTDYTVQELAGAKVTALAQNENFHTDIGGLTDSRIHLDHRITFARAFDRRSGFGCLNFDKIEIRMTLAPKIYIADDFEEKGCWFKEILTHELKHVTLDEEILEKYRERMKEALLMVYDRPSEYSSGVLTGAQMAGKKQRMKVDMERAIAVLFNRMQAERQERQAQVDTPQEYETISRACQRL